MPRILLLTASTSYRARDFLTAAASLDVEVIVGSDHRQVLERQSGGRSLYVSFEDPGRGTSAIVKHAQTMPVDAVIGTDDDSVVLAALAAEELGLPHSPAAAVVAARDKLRFRESMQSAGIAGPGFKVLPLGIVPQASPLTFPCVVKPRHLSASRGVLRVDSDDELARACERIERILASVPGSSDPTHDRALLLEEYIHGDEVALEGMLHHGRLEVLALFDKPDAMHGPTFEETLLITPSRLEQHVQDAVSSTVQRAVHALGLQHGPVHAEARLNGDGVWMVELAPRTVGGLCSRSLRFSGGDSLEALVIRNALSLGSTVSRMPEPARPASGVMMIPVPKTGRLHSVKGVDVANRVPGIEDLIISVPPGDEVMPLPEGDRYLGFIFARGATPQSVEKALRDAHAALDILVSG